MVKYMHEFRNMLKDALLYVVKIYHDWIDISVYSITGSLIVLLVLVCGQNVNKQKHRTTTKRSSSELVWGLYIVCLCGNGIISINKSIYMFLQVDIETTLNTIHSGVIESTMMRLGFGQTMSIGYIKKVQQGILNGYLTNSWTLFNKRIL